MNDCPPVSTCRPITTRRRALQLFAAIPLAGIVTKALAQDELGLEPDHPMNPVSERYAGLNSYSDSGAIETRYQWPGTPLTVERHRFQTAFRAPRNFFFRFDQDPAAGVDAYVIWCDGGPFQSWWKAIDLHTVHDNGQGAVAFYNGQSPTKDSANLIAPHLFPQAMLYGPTYRLIGAEVAGTEELGGRGTWKVTANQRVTGVQTSEDRPTTVWVDNESGLVVRVLVEAETGSPKDFIDSRDFVIEPVADPDLPDEVFAFDPKAGK